MSLDLIRQLTKSKRNSALNSSLTLLRLGWVLGLAGLLAGTTHVSATAARGYTGTQVFSTVGGDKDEGEPNHCGEPGGASSWFFYKAPRSGVMIVDTKGSSFDTVLAVYIGPGTDFASLTNVACNNDNSAGESWSRVVFDVVAGTMYYIAVDGVGGASGTVKLNYQLGDSLEITNQPQDVVQAASASATFAVGATGLAPFTYQWMYQGTPITGATQSSFTLPNVQASYEGLYSVEVRDSVSSLVSQTAGLIVCLNAPGANGVVASPVLINGTGHLRVVGNGAPGSVIESSPDLTSWIPVCTNTGAAGLFAIDEPLEGPMMYFRIHVAP
jgi:hypothetical protein